MQLKTFEQVEQVRGWPCLCCGQVDRERARIYDMVKSGIEVYCGDCPVGYDTSTRRVCISHKSHGRKRVNAA